MSSGEIFSSHEGEQSGEATRATYGERGRKVVESISLSELAAIDIKSLSDQELEDLNNRLKADIEAGYARLGILQLKQLPNQLLLQHQSQHQLQRLQLKLRKQLLTTQQLMCKLMLFLEVLPPKKF